MWLVRAGSHGEQEQGALENNVVTIGWNEIPDISKINDLGGFDNICNWK